MTVKELLHERIEGMTEEAAAELLTQLEWDDLEEEELTEEEIAGMLEGFAQIKRGDSVEGEKFLRDRGL
jgi:hypothetical protein